MVESFLHVVFSFVLRFFLFYYEIVFSRRESSIRKRLGGVSQQTETGRRSWGLVFVHISKWSGQRRDDQQFRHLILNYVLLFLLLGGNYVFRIRVLRGQQEKRVMVSVTHM